VFIRLKKKSKAGDSAFKRRSIPVAGLLIVVVLLSAGSGLYAGSFFAQQAPNVTITTTIFTTTSWTTLTIWSIVTSVVYGVWTTVQYTTSTSTVTVTGSTGPDSSTKLLLHMDGTDGSRTFVDSSPQAHSVPRKCCVA
jgi:preprotein translocase subunit SecG